MASVEQVQGSETAAEEVVNTVVEEGARLGVKRFFTIPGRDPFDEIEWETRDRARSGVACPFGTGPVAATGRVFTAA